jgi:hypothetical protein
MARERKRRVLSIEDYWRYIKLKNEELVAEFKLT